MSIKALLGWAGTFAQLEPVDKLFKVLQTALTQFEKALNDLELGNNKIQANFDYILENLIREEACSTTVSETGICTEMFLDRQILEKIMILYKKSSIDIKTIILSFASSLVSMLGIHFLFSGNVHQPLSELIEDKSMATSDKLIELEYHIAIKILESPELLDIFFFASHNEDVKPKFPIYDHLIHSCNISTNSSTFRRTKRRLFQSCI
jgi:Retinoic acid induced 16-like protein